MWTRWGTLGICSGFMARLPSLLLSCFQNSLKRVIAGCAVAFDFPAFRTAVSDYVALGLRLDRGWLHQALTLVFSITRIVVYVLAVETNRTMVCVPIAIDLCSAVFARKVFLATGKSPYHCASPFNCRVQYV